MGSMLTTKLAGLVIENRNTETHYVGEREGGREGERPSGVLDTHYCVHLLAACGGILDMVLC